MKNRKIIIAVGLIFLVSVCLSVCILRHSNKQAVEIVQDGTVIREIDLSRVARAYSFEVESADGGRNTILVEPGRICVSEANCPDQICVYQGWLSDQAFPIVCLPHRLVISLKDLAGASTDVVSR